MRNCLAYVPKGQHSMVAAAIRTVFTQEDAAAGTTAWRHVADQLRPRFPKLAALMDDAETDVLAFMSFPRAHWPKLHSTNPLERLNKEVKRRANVVGIFPNEASVKRLVGAILLEQNDEWQLQHRYMTLVWGLKCQAVMSDRYRLPLVLAVSVFGGRGRSRIDRRESGGDRPRPARRHGMSDRKPKAHTMQKKTNAA
jgi:transposase-like protein